jgi:hypothetical protein
MINYAELEPEPVYVPPQYNYEHVAGVNVPPPDTECNYLVMFFVVGVFFMAIMDGMEK